MRRMLVSKLAPLFAALSFGAVLSVPSAAQVQSPRPAATDPRVRQMGVIDGVVSDTGLAPMQGAFVSILGTSIRVGTGPSGRFRITKVPVGQYLVIVKRVGFRPTSGVVDVAVDDTVRLSYTLEKLRPEELETVVVTAKAPSMRMAEFEARRKLGVGEFMTSEEIEKRNTVFPTELIRKFRGVNISPNNAGPVTQYFALAAREGGNPMTGACPMQVYLDQVPLPSPFNLDLLPPPKELSGIEVYSGAATIPPQFSGMNRGCGVIMVWTKDGGA
ncbi:MAG TPA: carboxypeptidase regulatory-like domain-containing protein, partial [Gemmatimonadaceae bacterium]